MDDTRQDTSQAEELILLAPPEIREREDAAKEFRMLMQLYTAGIETVRTRFSVLDQEFKAKYDYNPIHHIESRLKDPRSIFLKMQRLGIPVSLEGMQRGLTDIAGVRVICNYIDDAETIAELLLRQEDIELIKKKDYIKNPKPNGYRSLHLVVRVPVYLAERTELVAVEVQIRTIAMDCWASLEHHLAYKSDGEIPPALRYRLQICALAISEVDTEMQEIKKEMEERSI